VFLKLVFCYILDSSVSQATAGIVAAIFCAVVFIGVGLLRCMMMGACNSCGGPNVGGAHQNRQVVGTNDSYAFQADFPPSYSTGMFLNFCQQYDSLGTVYLSFVHPPFSKR